MKILILTGRFGMGHYSASQSLAQKLKSADPDVTVTIEDIFDYTMPESSEYIYKAFSLMVNKGSLLYNQFYKLTENRKPDIKPVCLKFFLRKIDALLIGRQPDVIISTLPLCSQIMSKYKEKYRINIPLITCITDLSSHSEWINKETDIYLVGSRNIKERLIGKGVSSEKIYINGIPVKEEFCVPYKKAEKKQKNILIMGGGLGLLPRSMNFYQQLSEMENVKITVITGKNKEIYNRLYGRFDNIEVIGFTQEVHKYMQTADIIISKPGGITLFEAVQSETPFLVFKPFLQQEINNSRFITNREIGRVLDDGEEGIEEIRELVFNEIALQKLKKNVRNFKKEYDEHAVEQILYRYEVKGKGRYA